MSDPIFSETLRALGEPVPPIEPDYSVDDVVQWIQLAPEPPRRHVASTHWRNKPNGFGQKTLCGKWFDAPYTQDGYDHEPFATDCETCARKLARFEKGRADASDD